MREKREEGQSSAFQKSLAGTAGPTPATPVAPLPVQGMGMKKPVTPQGKQGGTPGPTVGQPEPGAMPMTQGATGAKPGTPGGAGAATLPDGAVAQPPVAAKPRKHSDESGDLALRVAILNGGAGAEMPAGVTADSFVTRTTGVTEREHRRGEDQGSKGMDSQDNAVVPVQLPNTTPATRHLHELSTQPAGPRTVQPPAALVQQLVEFAAVHRNNAGIVEFTLGMQQNVLGGMRVQLAAYGNRRVGITVKSASGKGTVGDEELAGLVDALRRRNVEVVEVVRA